MTSCVKDHLYNIKKALIDRGGCAGIADLVPVSGGLNVDLDGLDIILHDLIDVNTGLAEGPEVVLRNGVGVIGGVIVVPEAGRDYVRLFTVENGVESFNFIHKIPLQYSIRFFQV